MLEKFGKWINVGMIMAIAAGIGAYSEVIEKQKQEAKIEELENRVLELESH